MRPADVELPRVVRENRYCVLDLEATGVDVRRDEIIQVALIQVDHGRPRLRASSYVRPQRAHITDGAFEKHGLDYTVLSHAPTFADLLPDLRALIGDRVLLGFNIGRFDYPLLRRQCAEAASVLNHDVLDVIVWERKLHREKGAKHNLAVCAERYGVPQLQHHDALDDCRMTWNIFLQLAARFEELGNLDLSSALTSQASEPLPEGVLL